MRGNRPAASSRTSRSELRRATWFPTRRAGIPTALCIALAAACGHKRDEPKPLPLGDLVAALVTAAGAQAVPWRCGAMDVPVLTDEELKFGDASWKAAGTTLTR